MFGLGRSGPWRPTGWKPLEIDAAEGLLFLEHRAVPSDAPPAAVPRLLAAAVAHAKSQKLPHGLSAAFGVTPDPERPGVLAGGLLLFAATADGAELVGVLSRADGKEPPMSWRDLTARPKGPAIRSTRPGALATRPPPKPALEALAQTADRIARTGRPTSAIRR